MLSLLLSRRGTSVGVLASNTLTHSLWSCQVVCDSVCAWVFVVRGFVCECVWGASWLLPLTLVLRECQGCRCDFLHQPELHLLGHGVSSPWAFLLAPGASLGSDHSVLTLVWKVKTGADPGMPHSTVSGAEPSKAPSSETAGEKGEGGSTDTHLSVIHTYMDAHANYNLLFSWRTQMHTQVSECRCSDAFSFFIVYLIWIKCNWLPVGIFSYQPSVVPRIWINTSWGVSLVLYCLNTHLGKKLCHTDVSFDDLVWAQSRQGYTHTPRHTQRLLILAG